MARPQKYTPERAEQLCSLLEIGVTRVSASAAIGISEDTFARWLRAKDPSYSSFADSVRLAEARCGVRMARILMEAAEAGDYRAALGWLKLARPDDWGDKPFRSRMSDSELIARASSGRRRGQTTKKHLPNCRHCAF